MLYHGDGDCAPSLRVIQIHTYKSCMLLPLKIIAMYMYMVIIYCMYSTYIVGK